jgi:hypothetical protein
MSAEGKVEGTYNSSPVGRINVLMLWINGLTDKKIMRGNQ